ncbi:hypothetical protein AVEN_85634-1 [Araneus ventricosus]|uniref:Uncharacterized protein n=1 Tax=Araneus ventricosus TaxID=182803 RepID=A0A4Y2NW12_ARAVE|nr:hypothetical protein AVEN_85634-1 [Araneus ventricosus]
MEKERNRSIRKRSEIRLVILPSGRIKRLKGRWSLSQWKGVEMPPSERISALWFGVLTCLFLVSLIPDYRRQANLAGWLDRVLVNYQAILATIIWSELRHIR